jgi:putative membrane protein
LLSASMVWVLVGAGAMVVVALLAEPAAMLGMLPFLFGGVGLVWTRANSGAFFKAATSPDGLRLRHGLMESRAQTVPPGRVQAVSLSQGLLWRRAGWWRVQMNVAGDGVDVQAAMAGSDGLPGSVLHPVATRQEAATALWLVLPDLGVPDPAAMIDAALTGTGTAGGFVPAPRRSAWVDPWGWRRHGVLVTERALVLRSGRWWRRMVVVPHERTQSLGLAQGPLQRWLRLATFHLHSTPGPVMPQVAHLDEQVAADLLAQQAARARQARATAGSEQWMRPREHSQPDVLAAEAQAAETPSAETPGGTP